MPGTWSSPPHRDSHEHPEHMAGPLYEAVLNVLSELSPASLQTGGNLSPRLPALHTPLSRIFTDSMMVLSALLALEEKLPGDLGNLDPSAPPPRTLEDFMALGAKLNPNLTPDRPEIKS